MSEPEDVLLDGAYHASTAVQALWRRRRPGPPRVELGDVKGRLDLLISALFARSFRIAPAEPPARPTPMARWVHRIPRHLRFDQPLCTTDGVRIRLPPTLEAVAGEDAAVRHYRILALEQAARAERGSVDVIHGVDDRLVRELYWLCEAVAIDLDLARDLPGWAADLAAARRAALADRTPLVRPTGLERRAEAMVREVLAAPPLHPPSWSPPSASPADSLRWAREQAAMLEAETVDGGRFRGIPVVEVWGVPSTPDSGQIEVGPAGEGASRERKSPRRIGKMSRRPRVRDELENEDDQNSGMWALQLDDPQEHVEDPLGLQRPTDRDDQADSDDLADSLSELPEARVVHTPGTPPEVLASPAPPERRATVLDPESGAIGITYPEWNWQTDRYRLDHVVVRMAPAPQGDEAWSDKVLAAHAAHRRQIRRTFERLRPRRVRFRRQTDGPDLDLEAWVSAWSTQRAGGAVEDRLYEAVRPSRRELAISLLVDVSGSTDSWVAGTRRVVDVEKEALLMVCEGLDALGDRYNVLAFSGEGPRGVDVLTVKSFDEGWGSTVRGRIAALHPDRFTRVGAALRHASTLLARESAAHRLLLLLSDGKPNDVDQYEGRYGIEDARQAIAEARLQQIHPHCLTIDRQAPAYARRIFGPTGFSVLHDPTRLPEALVRVVQQLITA